MKTESANAWNAVPMGSRLCKLASLSLMLSVAGASASLAQQPSWEQVLTEARKEGSVTFYTSVVNPVADRLVAGFEKEYPEISAEYFRATSGKLLARIEQERSAGIDGADVLLATELAWLTEYARKGEILNPIGPAAADWPAAFLHEDAVVVPSLDPFVIPYNKSLAGNPPTGYHDFLRPELKGKIAIGEIAGSATSVGFYDWLERTQGQDYLTKLKEQEPRLLLGSNPITQSVAAGETLIGLISVPALVGPMIDKGAPLGMVFPNPAFGYAYYAGALGWAKNKNAALVFMDYIMSREGQTVWHGPGYSASPLSSIPGSLDAATIDPVDAAAYPPERVNSYSARFDEIFN